MFVRGAGSKEYRMAQNDIKALRNKRFRDKVMMGTIPILKNRI